jgi:uncharacterized protein (DUF983 family)
VSTPVHPFRHPFRLVAGRGLKGLCPQCGGAPLFEKGFQLGERCPRCGLDYRIDEANLWAVLYFTTAFITGLILIGMLLITPSNIWVGRLVVVAVALTAWLGTYRPRKGLGVAVLYYTEWRWNNHGRYELRTPGSVPPSS